MAPPVLEFRKIVKRFDTVTAVDAVNNKMMKDKAVRIISRI